MFKSFILRFCLCSLLVICFAIDTSAQRAARRRSVTTVEKSSPDTARITITIEDLAVLVKDAANPLIELPDTNLDITKTEEVESTTEKPMGSPDCRETKAINKTNQADAYPYLTEDGLRLYFTSNREGGHGRFFISTRKSLRDPFGEPTVLSKDLTDGYYAGTLTADELTLCMVKAGSMYISVRKSKIEEFPVPVKLTGTDNIYHFGPSISADGKEIIVTVSPTGNDRTRLYKRTGTYHVEAVKELPAPVDGEAGPGQLSKDGLYYYFTIEKKTSEHLWRYSRASLSDDFSKLEEFPVQMKGLKCVLQPSLNKDGTVIVFVTARSNSWDADDILLVSHLKKEPELPKLPDNILSDVGTTVKMPEKTNMPQLIVYSDTYTRNPEKQEVIVKPANPATPGKMMAAPTLLQLKVYPNPFTTVIHVEIKDLPAEGAFFNLYDISGKKIQQVKINSNITTISLDQLIRGTYSFDIVNKKGELISSGKLVKIE